MNSTFLQSEGGDRVAPCFPVKETEGRESRHPYEADKG